MGNYFSGCNGTTCNSSIYKTIAIILAVFFIFILIALSYAQNRAANAVRCNGHCYPYGYKHCSNEKTICSNDTVVIKKDWEK